MNAVLHPQTAVTQLRIMAFKKTFLISDETLNSHGFWTRTEGINIELAKKNCPCFYDHKTWEVPLGHWENHVIKNGKYYADLIIEGGNEAEKEYIRKIENKDLQCASFGADPIMWNGDTKVLLSGQSAPALWECEIYEISLLPLPSNKNAIALRNESGLVKLSSTNITTIIPALKTETDMKAIALKLGLAETATENDILTAIGAVQLAKTTAEAFNQTVLADAEKELTDEQKPIFVELSKTNPAQALKFVALSKKTADTTTEPPTKTKVADLIKTGKKPADNAVAKTYDYLQKHDPVELKRIHAEDPAEYNRLAADYNKGIRHTA